MELLSELVAYKAVYNCLHVERELFNGFVIQNYSIETYVLVIYECGTEYGLLKPSKDAAEVITIVYKEIQVISYNNYYENKSFSMKIY